MTAQDKATNKKQIRSNKHKMIPKAELLSVSVQKVALLSCSLLTVSIGQMLLLFFYFINPLMEIWATLPG